MKAQDHSRIYPPGSRVRILRGPLADQIMTVLECTADEIRFVERPRRESMSKRNVAPAEDVAA